ncbi:MAG: DUF547 domain-containing protein [Bacteroidota bacterium]
MFRSVLSLLALLVLQSQLFAATSTAAFFNETDALLMRYVDQGRIDYAGLQQSDALQPLLEEIAAVDLNSLSGNERKAYLINAYNLLVISQALEHYPLNSVLDVSGFFDRQRHTVGGRQLTLNQLEKDLLLREFSDARLHFVLVCGALGCPPITEFAYQPQQLEAQLNRQTRLALNDPNFIQVAAEGNRVQLSQIFEWYAADFGGSKANVLRFINEYREREIPAGVQISYYNYDWSLNESRGRAQINAPEEQGVSPIPGGGNNSARYVVSSAIPEGSFEIKIFNNLYSQEAAGERSSFFTSNTSVLYGLTSRINVGFDLRVRRVRYDEAGTASNFDVFGSNGASFSRTTVSGFGPKVRIAPFESLPNFSIQSALWLPIGDDLSGAASDQRFLEFDGPIWFTQVFNDFPIGGNFSFFAEVDFVLEDIGSAENGRINRFSTPVTGIFSYFPTPKTTLYGLASYSPFWQENNDYFYQLGAGAKYQFTPKFELEILATAFDNQFLSSVNGNAGTVNLGVRFNL